MELRDYMKWRLANLYAVAFVVVAGVISLIPARPIWFGVIPNHVVQLCLTVAAGVAVQLVTKKFVRAFEDFQPETPLQAKRANEQIKLMASFANAIATAVVAVIVISQSIKDIPPANITIFTGCIIAGMIHVGGRNLVSLLKPERPEDLVSMTAQQGA